MSQENGNGSGVEPKVLKVSLCMVVKDEDWELDRCLNSVKGLFDEIVIGWNGTNKKTKEVMVKHGVKIIPVVWRNDHGAVRQETMQHVTGDVMMWLDADDTLENADKLHAAIVHTFSNPRMGALWLDYEYMQDADGNSLSFHSRERVVRPQWFHWPQKFHETLIQTARVDHQIMPYGDRSKPYVQHHTTFERIKASNIRCLTIAKEAYEKEQAAGKVDPRTVYDLGRALVTCQMYDLALQAFQEYVGISGWDDERYMAYCSMADIYRNRREFENAIVMAHLAMKTRPKYPDAYLSLASTYFSKEMWDECLMYCEMAQTLEAPVGAIPCNPMKYKFEPLRMMHWCLIQTNRVQAALACVEHALTIAPSDEGFQDARTRYRKLERHLLVQNSLVELEHILREYGEEGKVDRLKAFREIIPADMMDHPKFVRLQHELYPVTEKNKIVIYCGDAFEHWDPDSLTTGIGGSEEAVIHVAERLAARGWIVEVYGKVAFPREVRGVRWLNYYTFTNTVPCDIFIAWRDCAAAYMAPKGSRAFLWLHDIQEEQWYNPEIKARFEKIFVLSKHHRTYLPDTPEEKFFYTRNGIDVHQFKDNLTRNPNRAIYMSSPDRGLNELFNMWPVIKSKAPKAEVDVYYWFTVNYDHFRKEDSRFMKFKEDMITASKQPGIRVLGRVGHPEIAEACSTAGMWLYPAHFPEISCISAMKAQAGGAIPCTTDFAALDETVQYGTKIHGSSSDPAVMKQWTEAAIEYFNHPEKQEAIRAEMMAWARKTYAWDAVAAQWDELFKSAPVAKEAVPA